MPVLKGILLLAPDESGRSSACFRHFFFKETMVGLTAKKRVSKRLLWHEISDPRGSAERILGSILKFVSATPQQSEICVKFSVFHTVFA